MCVPDATSDIGRIMKTPSTVSLWNCCGEQRTLLSRLRCKADDDTDACLREIKPAFTMRCEDWRKKMNITVVEPERTNKRARVADTSMRLAGRRGSVANEGQGGFHASRRRDRDCVSCSKSMFNGGKNARYLIDLLLMRDSAGTCDPVALQ